MTQFFFENDRYFDYLDKVRARGIYIPIVPGILPVQNFKQTKNFADRCGASIPRWLAERFDGLDEDVATRKLIAAAVAAEQVLDLVAGIRRHSDIEVSVSAYPEKHPDSPSVQADIDML